jgi:hypothetical protein
MSPQILREERMENYDGCVFAAQKLCVPRLVGTPAFGLPRSVELLYLSGDITHTPMSLRISMGG